MNNEFIQVKQTKMAITIQHMIRNDKLIIRQKINEPIKFNYMRGSKNKYETFISKNYIDKLCSIFSAQPDYCWKLFETLPDIISNEYGITLRWNIVSYDMSIDINLRKS